MHDARTGQRLLDEAAVEVVVRQLVDETRTGPDGLGGARRAYQIVLAYRAQIDTRSGGHHLFARQTAAPCRALDRRDQRLRERQQLARAVHLGVAAEDALHQGRAGARHADHEDRPTGRLRGAHRSQARRRQRIDDEVHRLQIAREVVVDVATAQRGAGAQLHEGLGVPADILELLGERVADEHLVARMRERLRRQGFERGDVVALRRLAAQFGAVQPGLMVAGVERERAVVGRLRLIDATDEAQQRGAVEEILRPRGVELDGARRSGERLVVQTHRAVERTDGVLQPGVVTRFAARTVERSPRGAGVARAPGLLCAGHLVMPVLVHVPTPMLRQHRRASGRQNCQDTLRPSVRGRRKDSEEYSGGGRAPPAPVKVGLLYDEIPFSSVRLRP